MIPTKEEIKTWLEKGLAQGATHMIVVRDLSDGHYKPIYVLNKENPKDVYDKHNDGDSYRAGEVYSLKMDMNTQLEEDWAFHFD